MASGIHPKLPEVVTLGGVAIRALPGFTLHETHSGRRQDCGHLVHTLVYRRVSDGMCFTVSWGDDVPPHAHDSIWTDFAKYIAEQTPRYN